MKTIGNILWFLFTGFSSAVAWFLCGVMLCITIVGIPFGEQCFKIASLVFWPFGRTVYFHFERHPIANILWAIFLGWEYAVSFFVMGLLWCVTIVGIPFGKQCFKLAKLSLMPFGAIV